MTVTGEAASGPTRPLGVAVVGAGYWGPNLIRNFRSSTDWDLVAVCDLDVARAHTVLGARSGVSVTATLDDLLARDDVDAVAIATPARTHQGIALRALGSGKHVLVEKPLADSVVNGEAMVEMARRQGLVLMADHTYCYTPAVLKIRELVASGELGDILFVDSVRINLGLVQPDVDVFWDLAPHDLSDPRLRAAPGAETPRRRGAGSGPVGGRQELRGLPEPAAGRGRDGARPRQLAQPHQDPADGDQRDPPHPGLGRPQPAAAAQRVRPRGGPGAQLGHRSRSHRVDDLLPAGRHLGAGTAGA